MMLPRIYAVLALLFSLLVTSVIAQSPVPTPTVSLRVPARRANTDTDTNTKTGNTKTSTSTTSSHSTGTKSTATGSLTTSTSTPSATSSPTSSPSSSSSSLSTGAIAAIAVGVVAAVALIAAGSFLYIWRMRKSRQMHRQSMNPRGTLGGVTPITETAPMNNMYKSINDESSRSTDPSPTAEGDVEAYGALGAPGNAGAGGEGQSKLDPAAMAGDGRGPSVELDGTERPAVTPALPNSPVELGTSP